MFEEMTEEEQRARMVVSQSKSMHELHISHLMWNAPTIKNFKDDWGGEINSSPNVELSHIRSDIAGGSSWWFDKNLYVMRCQREHYYLIKKCYDHGVFSFDE